MSIQDLLNQISDFKEKKSYYKKLIQALDRIDKIEVHFKKTKDFIGNHGYAEGNDSFSFVLDDSRKDEFYNMQKTFMDTIEYKYKIYDAKLTELEKKKESLEEVLSSLEKE